MNERELLELCPIAALGALDGDERSAFLALLPRSERLQAELRAFERVASLIPLALASVEPKPGSRLDVLDMPVPALAPARAARRARVLTWLAAAAALGFASSALLMRGQRDDAREETRAAREQAASLGEVNARLGRDLESARIALAEGRSVRDLVGRPGLRLVSMAGQKPALNARARALYDPATSDALLLVTGLERAPEGKAYEVWVIAGPAPTPAGTFQVEVDGSALVRLPWLDETSRVKGFAVSLEPAVGVPAPTGPIVLLGSAP